METFGTFDNYARSANRADSIASLLGYKGAVANLYFGNFGAMLKNTDLRFAETQPATAEGPRERHAVVVLPVARPGGRRRGSEPRTRPGCGFPARAGRRSAVVGFRPHGGVPAADCLFRRPAVGEPQDVTGNSFSQDGLAVILTRQALRKVVHAFEERLEATVKPSPDESPVSYRELLRRQAGKLLAALDGGGISYAPFVIRPMVSQTVRIMLYAAGLVAWLFVVPAQGAAKSAEFVELVIVVLVGYFLLRTLFRSARILFWVIAVVWCVASLWVITSGGR